MTSSGTAIAPGRTRWSAAHVALALFLAGVAALSCVLIGPALAAAGVAVAVVGWLSVRPARGLAIFTWLLPFHILVIAVLFGGLGVSAAIARTLAAWKEALVVACVLAVIVAATRRRVQHGHGSGIGSVDVAVGTLFVIAACHLVAAGPWLGSDLTLVGKAYAFRDVALFLLLYFVGRECADDVAENRATLSRLYTVGVIAAIFAVIEYIFVPPELLAAIGTSRYFNEFLNASAFTSDNPYGLPSNYVDIIGGQLVRRAGSTYLSSTALASAQVVSLAAASVIIFQRKQRVTLWRWVGYGVIWIGLFLSITRMSIVAALAQALLIAVWFRRRGLAIAAAAATLTAACAVLVVSRGVREFVWDTVTFQSPSSVTHLTAWTNAIDIAIDHPFGAGLGSADETAVRFSAREPLTGDNLFFKYSAELGIPAFIVHLWMLFGIAAAGWTAAKHGSTSARRNLGVTVLALTVGILINGMTAVLYNSTFLAYIYFWLAGSAVTVARASVAERART